MLRLLTFSLYCYGLELHWSAGELLSAICTIRLADLFLMIIFYLLWVLTIAPLFQGIGSSSFTFSSQSGRQTTTSEFCSIFVYCSGICLLFIKVVHGSGASDLPVELQLKCCWTDRVSDILKFICILQNSLLIHAWLHVYEIKYALFLIDILKWINYPC